ncbi:MAG: glycoside hydrolase family 3 N-terminal domain-containing protein [Bacteroidota bacterium]
MLLKKITLTLSVCLYALFSLAQTQNDSLDIKIGQMIMLGINDRTELADSDPLIKELNANKLGGVVLFEKNISKTDARNKLKTLITVLKSNTPIPLLVSIDEEGGKVHRLKPKYGFVAMPSAAYLGKLDNRDSTLFYNRALAAELAGLGFNFNYAPSLDLAINPENTVIVKRERSFSAKNEMVSKHALLCIKAHHENGVKTILKHFPGHGSSTGDSHLGIVDVTETWDFKELFPYYDILKSGSCDAIMTAHLVNRNWDSTYLPATLSSKVVTGMLRGLLGFKGVVFSDDMQMKAISSAYGVDKSIEMAVNAGVDIIMFGNNVDPKDKPVTATEIHEKLKKLVMDGKIRPERINEAYNRIMKMKNTLVTGKK